MQESVEPTEKGVSLGPTLWVLRGVHERIVLQGMPEGFLEAKLLDQADKICHRETNVAQAGGGGLATLFMLVFRSSL